MLTKLFEKNPSLAILVTPVAAAFDIDPDRLAGVFLGIAIAAEINEMMKQAEAAIAAKDQAPPGPSPEPDILPNDDLGEWPAVKSPG